MARNDDMHGDYFAKHKRKDMSRSKPSDMVSSKSISTSDKYSEYDGSSNHIRNIEIPAELMRSTIGRFFFKSVVDKLEDRIEQRIEELDDEQGQQVLSDYLNEQKTVSEKENQKARTASDAYRRTKLSGLIDIIWYGLSIYIAFAWFFPIFADSLRNSSAIGLGAILAIGCVIAGFLVTLPLRLRLSKWIG